MKKSIRFFSTVAGVFLLSAAFAFAQGGMMGNGQSGMTNGTQNNGSSNQQNGPASPGTFHQQMMQWREQFQSKVRNDDQQLADLMQQLRNAKSDNQKIQLMQKMFGELVSERDYIHNQALAMMMYGNGMMYGDGMMYGGTQMQGGPSGMMSRNQNGMRSGSQNSDQIYGQMMQRRQNIQPQAQTTDKELGNELQQLQAAKSDTQKVQIMQEMLANLVNERTYVHDQVLSMMMLNRQTQSARP